MHRLRCVAVAVRHRGAGGGLRRGRRGEQWRRRERRQRQARDAQDRPDPDRRRRAGLPRPEEGVLQGAADHARPAVRGGRRRDHAGRDQRRLRHRLLQHGLAADRRLEEAAGPDHLPGGARRRGRLQGLGGPAGPQGRRDHGAQGPRGQDDRRQHAQQHLRGHHQRLAGEDGRRRLEAEVHRDPLPGDGRRAAEGARRRGVRRGAVRQPGQGHGHDRDRPVLLQHRAEPDGGDLLRVEGVHREEPGRRRPLRDAR